LQPILYQPEVLPAPLKALIYANPFSHLVFCYQDVLYFGGFAHTFSWFVLVFASGAVLVLGYWFFRRLAPYFGNVL
jgi:lipopolysaccharide transport system permease protein